MFVKKGYRGKPLLIGQQLLDTLLKIERISESDLPNNFQIMEVDKYFYKMILG